MSLSSTAPLVSLFLFSSFAIAGIYAPDCSTTWKWSFNSLGQNACTVAAYMLSTCHGGSYTIDALKHGYEYSGPPASDGADLCICSTVAYSLISACDGCQGEDWITWSEFSYNCTTKMIPGTFPNPIPAGTRVPQWTLLDITSVNKWDANTSKSVGDSPEVGPGIILGESGPSSPSVSTSTRSTNTYPTIGSTTFYPPNPSSNSSLANSTSSVYPAALGGKSSNAGAIAGGVVGGIAAISIIIAALLFYMRRPHPPAPPAASMIEGQPGGFDPVTSQVPSPRPMSGEGTVESSVPGTSTSLLRVYNVDDPTTYPTYQGPLSPPPTYNLIQPSSPTSSRNLYTVATPPHSQGEGLGHNALHLT